MKTIIEGTWPHCGYIRDVDNITVADDRLMPDCHRRAWIRRRKDTGRRPVWFAACIWHAHLFRKPDQSW